MCTLHSLTFCFWRESFRSPGCQVCGARVLLMKLQPPNCSSAPALRSTVSLNQWQGNYLEKRILSFQLWKKSLKWWEVFTVFLLNSGSKSELCSLSNFSCCHSGGNILVQELSMWYLQYLDYVHLYKYSQYESTTTCVRYKLEIKTCVKVMGSNCSQQVTLVLL